jgi:hypothetical protein
MALGILVMVTALCISAVAIYYSIAGLVAIFAAAAIPIMVMGGALEIGKLVTAVWLHKYWGQAKWWLRSYLALSVVVLMLITSMGIFGFLSKAHIEQTSASIESVESISRMEEEIARQELLIVRAEERIVNAEASIGKNNSAIQQQIDTEQSRIDKAYDRIEPAIAEQNVIIETQLSALEDKVSVYSEEIKALDLELIRLNGLVDQYRQELSTTTLASVEDEIKPYLDQISQLDADLERINTQANQYEQRISEVKIDGSAIEALQKQIADIENAIVVTTNKLQSTERAKIQEGQAVIGVTSDGLFGSNTRTALAKWVDAQQSRISTLQTQAVELRTQAQSTLDAERTRLTDLVKDLRGPQAASVQKRKQALLDTIDTIRNDEASSLKDNRSVVQAKIDTVLTTDITANRDARRLAQTEITKLRQADDVRITSARTAIKELRVGADAQIAASNKLIQQLRDSITVGADADVDQLVSEQQAKIKVANDTIDSLTQQKYDIEAEYRKLEAEVGPVKYIAEFVYGTEADRDILEEAVRWVIITIIFVFDPLAVLLLIASQYTFEFNRKRKDDDGERLRQEYEQARAQRIVDNPGFTVEMPEPASQEEKVEDARVDEPTDSNIQDGDVEHHERDREADDAEDLSRRSVVESTEEQVPNSDEAQEQTDTSEDPGGSVGEIPEQVAVRELEYAEKEKETNWVDAKRRWKEENPKEHIKEWKQAYINGEVDEVPWEKYLEEGTAKRYIFKDKEAQVKDIALQEDYKQNAEQNESTIWNRLKRDKD